MMNNLITIQSKIYSGKTLNIVFIPDNQHIKIDLGNHVIPYTIVLKMLFIILFIILLAKKFLSSYSINM